jgi:hypothetical protein
MGWQTAFNQNRSKMPTPSLRASKPAAQSPAKKLQANTAKAALENRLSKQLAVPRLSPKSVTKLTPANLTASRAIVATPVTRVGPLPIAPAGGQQLPPPAALGVTSLPSPPAAASDGTADIGLTASERDQVQSLFLANLSMNLSAIDGLPANAAATAQQFHLTTMLAEAFAQVAPGPISPPVTSLREARLADQTQIFKLMQDITTIKNSPAPQFDGLIRQ